MFLPLCLSFWLAGILTTQGEVSAPARVPATAGHPATLVCNVTMATVGDRLRQVRWLDARGQLLLAYKPGSSPLVTSPRWTGVELASAHGHGSAVTVAEVRAADEGCYRCVFNIFPSGSREGKTCLVVTARVATEGNKTAVSGRRVALSCRYGLPERVKQVLWRKTVEQGDTASVGSYSGRGGLAVAEAFRDRHSLSSSLGETELTIRLVGTEDEGCYTCEFHTFPEGTRSATSCLSVYVLPQPEVGYETTSSGVTEANCSARSRPPARLTWLLPGGGGNQTLGPAVSSYHQQGDGTTLVTSTLLFLQSPPLDPRSVKCVAHHPGLDTPIYVSLDSNVGAAMIVLISVCGVAAILLLCLCVCLCKCFVCPKD